MRALFHLCRDLRVGHPRRLVKHLTRDELLDWLALYEVDAWGPGRDDRRAACQSLWNRGLPFSDVEISFPYIKSEEDEIEADLEALAEIERERELEREQVARLIKEQATHATT